MIRKLLFLLKWRIMRPMALKKFNELGECNQESARQNIVRWAMTHTKFYRKFYADAGMTVDDIGKDGWWERLPIVTKAHLNGCFEDMTDQAQRRFRKTSTTGGSTGVPTKCGYDGRICEEVYSWRLQESWGVHPWDDHAYAWRDSRRWMARLANAIMWCPTRHLKLNATFITDDAIVSFLNKCLRVKPRMMQGYVGAVTQVARFIVDNLQGISADGHYAALSRRWKRIDWRPEFVWTTSAPISTVQRRLIERAFKAPVCDQYGSCELRWIAQEEPGQPGLRVNAEHVYIEYCDEDNLPVPMGQYGKALVTNLEDTVFPLIRYENGDRGRLLGENRIDSVKGRESESFILPSGKTVNGEFLTTIFDAKPELVKGFRCIQHRDASMTIEYIPAGDETEILNLLEAFADKLGTEVPIAFKRVEKIDHDRGKLRFIVKE